MIYYRENALGAIDLFIEQSSDNQQGSFTRCKTPQRLHANAMTDVTISFR